MIKHLIKKICLYCKKEFLTRQDRVNIFCSRKCYELHRQENRAKYNCKTCNKKITFNSVKYGSGLCGSCEHKERLKDKRNHPMFGKHHTEKTKELIRKANSGENSFNFGKRGKESTRFKHGRYSKDYHNYCLTCHKELSRSDAKYCSVCESKSRIGQKRPEHSKKMKGKRNPNFINGLGNEPYSFEWRDDLKEQIRQRDNYTCQYCRITQEEHLKKYNQKLHVHHIDYNKKNCEENNLITLCNICNNKANYNRDYYYAYFRYKIDNLKK